MHYGAEMTRDHRMLDRSFRDLLWDDVPVLAIALALFCIELAIFLYNGIAVGLELAVVNARLYTAAGFAMLVIDMALLLIRNRPDRPTMFLIETYVRRLRSPVFLAALPIFAFVIVFMPFFSKMKSMIALFNDFSWDLAFIAWDRFIFFGYDAWEVLQPVLGYPYVTAALAVAYHLWMLLIYAGTLFFVFYQAAAGFRREYLLGFFLIWTVIGNVLATMLASVGPCFVGPILGMNTFDAQMAYLNKANETVPIMTLRVQELLLGWYHEGERGLGSGITAMPSMHVAMAMLFWLAVRRVSPAAGKLFFAFFVVIWVGSVHLAYHYFVNGLVSVVATLILWQLSQAIIRWWDAQAFARRQPTLRTNTVPAE